MAVPLREGADVTRRDYWTVEFTENDKARFRLFDTLGEAKAFQGYCHKHKIGAVIWNLVTGAVG